jgi:hypothetical protein
MNNMITLLSIALSLAIAGALGVATVKFAAEDRPGFDERAPLS